MTPVTGTVGTRVTISCTGYASNDNITIAFGTNSDVQSALASQHGSFTAGFTVDVQCYGTTTITARGIGSAIKSFHILPEVVSVMPAAGTVGTIITIIGTGYAAGDVVRIDLGKTATIQKVVASNYGSFTVSFTVDTQVYGTTTIIANGTRSIAAVNTFFIYPEIMVTPNRGTVGTTVIVAGTGYAANDFITVKFRVNINTQQLSASNNGSFSTTFTVNEQNPGTTTIIAVGGNSVVNAVKIFRILPEIRINPVIDTVMPNKGTVGTVVTIKGGGYASDDNITVAFGVKSNIQQTIANIYGSFSTTFTIDTQSYGTTTITASGTVAVASNVFIIQPQVVSVMPMAGTVGTAVTITGTGYAANGSITVAFGVGATANIKITIASNYGSFTTTFTIDTQSYGTTTITAKDAIGVAASNMFHIMPAVYSVTPTAGTVGTVVSISGNGYSANEEITIKFGNTASIATISSETKGSFKASFVVDTQRGGTTTITCKGSNSGVVAYNTFFIGTSTGSGAPVLSTSTTTGTPICSENGGTITLSGKLGQTTLKIPPDALAEDSQISLTEIAKTAGKLAIANFNAKSEKNMSPLQDSCISLVCTSKATGKPVSSTKQAMKLCIPYIDNNHDGIVDETTICVETLKIFKLNEVSNRWEILEYSYPMATKCEVWANIYEFGVYAIMSYEPVYSLSDVTVYPNPFYPNMNQKCKFSPLPSGRLTISIYNSAGEQVKTFRRYSNEGIAWDGNNDQEESVASGIYFYLIKNAEGKRTGKIGLIR